MDTIFTISQLDAAIEEIEVLSEDARRQRWLELKCDEQLFGGWPQKLKKLDPFSAEYQETVKEFLRHLHKQEYSTSNEGFEIDIGHLQHIGYPYITQSADVVGRFLMAYGFIIKEMGLPPYSRILDIGCGTGSLSIHLARMGYDLTCVDVNPGFVELMTRMTEMLPNQVNCVCANMASLEFLELFDGILFMESFHHSMEHRETVARLKRYLKSEGRMFFAAEPVIKQESAILPYPWGPRLDGESLRSMRLWGWVELGFTENYFYEMLRRNGFRCQRTSSSETHWGDLITAQLVRSISWGGILQFNKGTDGTSHLLDGWSQPEEFGTWTVGERANLRLQINISETPVVIRMRYVPFLAPNHRSQAVSLYCNGKLLTKWADNGETWREMCREVLIPCPDESDDDDLLLSFEIHNPKSPKDINLTNDERKLGLALISIEYLL